MSEEMNRVTSPDGKLVLVFENSSTIDVHDARTDAVVATLDPKTEFKWACFDTTSHAIFVGAKNIASFDITTKKKNKLLFKGHKAPANCMVVDAARNHLYSAGGDYIYSDDRMVRAFDIETGALLWKLGGKKAGFECCALFDDTLVVAAENGVLYVLDPDDGTVLCEAPVDGGCTPQEPGSSIWLGVNFTRLAIEDEALFVHYWKGERKDAENKVVDVRVNKAKRSIALGTPKSLGMAFPIWANDDAA